MPTLCEGLQTVVKKCWVFLLRKTHTDQVTRFPESEPSTSKNLSLSRAHICSFTCTHKHARTRIFYLSTTHIHACMHRCPPKRAHTDITVHTFTRGKLLSRKKGILDGTLSPHKRGYMCMDSLIHIKSLSEKSR